MSESKTFHKNPNFFKDLKKRYKGGMDVAVGIPKGGESIGVSYPDGTPVLEVAFYNEFGTEKIPSRPAIKLGGRRAVKELGEELIAAIRNTNGGDSLFEELSIIGMQAAAIVQDSIVYLKSPPNAQSTIDAKGSSNPLMDTALYRNSITYQVRDKS